MTGFRECAEHVFKRLGMPVPPSYLDDLERMNEAAAEWHRLPENRLGGVLHFEVPDLLSGIVYTGDLPIALTNGWAANEAAKSFVRYVDKRSRHRGTLLMLQVLLLIQEVARERGSS